MIYILLAVLFAIKLFMTLFTEIIDKLFSQILTIVAKYNPFSYFL